ncbi:MAG: DUF3293 domain-containing protein [Saprospirales bacterium]|nr:MAG: DUF3293 domain-containing protein [Saprospirales bacterium]
MSNDSFNDLVKAYYSTIYRIIKPRIELKPGRICPQLDLFLEENGIDKWAVITAFNPNSRHQNDKLNDHATRRLKKRLDEAGKRYRDLVAEADPDSPWPPEYGFFAEVSTLQEAVELSGDFDQKAIVYGERGVLPSIVWIASLGH